MSIPMAEGRMPRRAKEHTCSSTFSAVVFTHEGGVRLKGIAVELMPLPGPWRRPLREQNMQMRHNMIFSKWNMHCVQLSRCNRGLLRPCDASHGRPTILRFGRALDRNRILLRPEPPLISKYIIFGAYQAG